MVDNTPEAWFAALDRKIANLESEKALAWERRRWALKHVTFESNVNAYGDVFGRILAEKSVKQGARLPGVTYVQAQAAEVVTA